MKNEISKQEFKHIRKIISKGFKSKKLILKPFALVYFTASKHLTKVLTFF